MFCFFVFFVLLYVILITYNSRSLHHSAAPPPHHHTTTPPHPSTYVHSFAFLIVMTTIAQHDRGFSTTATSAVAEKSTPTTDSANRSRYHYDRDRNRGHGRSRSRSRERLQPNPTHDTDDSVRVKFNLIEFWKNGITKRVSNHHGKIEGLWETSATIGTIASETKQMVTEVNRVVTEEHGPTLRQLQTEMALLRNTQFHQHQQQQQQQQQHHSGDDLNALHEKVNYLMQRDQQREQQHSDKFNALNADLNALRVQNQNFNNDITHSGVIMMTLYEYTNSLEHKLRVSERSRLRLEAMLRKNTPNVNYPTYKAAADQASESIHDIQQKTQRNDRPMFADIVRKIQMRYGISVAASNGTLASHLFPVSVAPVAPLAAVTPVVPAAPATQPAAPVAPVAPTKPSQTTASASATAGSVSMYPYPYHMPSYTPPAAAPYMQSAAVPYMQQPVAATTSYVPPMPASYPPPPPPPPSQPEAPPSYTTRSPAVHVSALVSYENMPRLESYASGNRSFTR